MRYIVVAASPYHNFDKYQYQDGDIFVGMEDGCLEILKRNFPLNLAIGDFDHTSNMKLINENAQLIKKYNKDKNEIDLELVLMYLKDVTCPIYIYNAAYGRIDHELITIKLLIKYQALDIILVTDNEEVRYITDDYIIPMGHHFSLIPYEKVTINIRGALYNLNNVTLNLDDNYTSSNYALYKTEINVKDGGIILIIQK